MVAKKRAGKDSGKKEAAKDAGSNEGGFKLSYLFSPAAGRGWKGVQMKFAIAALIWVCSRYFLRQHTAVREMRSDPVLELLTVQNPDGALVNFYMEDCKHCKKLAPEFEKAAKRLASDEGSPPFAAASKDAVPQMVKQLGIERYPTMLWFKKGKAVYEASPTVRSVDKIVDFVNWVSQPAVVDFDQLVEFEEALPQLRQTMQAHPVMAAFASSEAFAAAYEYAAEKSRGKAVFVNIKDVPSDAASSLPKMRAYFSNSELDQDYTGPANDDSVHAWVSELLRSMKDKTAGGGEAD